MYAEDLKDSEEEIKSIVSLSENVAKSDVEETKNLWEATFDQPYEKAGAEIAFNVAGISPIKPPLHWQVSDTDINTKYKSLLPRFLLEVSSLSLFAFHAQLHDYTCDINCRAIC